MSEKIYVGSGVEKFDGNLVDVSINVTKIINTEHIYEYEGQKYIKLKVVKKRETDQYGKTHYVEVNTYKPPITTDKPASFENYDDELPF